MATATPDKWDMLEGRCERLIVMDIWRERISLFSDGLCVGFNRPELVNSRFRAVLAYGCSQVNEFVEAEGRFGRFHTVPRSGIVWTGTVGWSTGSGTMKVRRNVGTLQCGSGVVQPPFCIVQQMDWPEPDLFPITPIFDFCDFPRYTTVRTWINVTCP